MDNPVLKVEATVSLDAISTENRSSPFRTSKSPTEMVKNEVIQEVDARIRQAWDKTKCAELGISDHYTSVAVLIIHWARHLDEDLKSWKEVRHPSITSFFVESFRTDSRVGRAA